MDGTVQWIWLQIKDIFIFQVQSKDELPSCIHCTTATIHPDVPDAQLTKLKVSPIINTIGTASCTRAA